MKIKVQRNKLNDAIDRCLKAVSKKPIIPSTGNILFTQEAEFLGLSSTDTNMSVRQLVSAEILVPLEEFHSVSVSAAVLSGIISGLTKDYVELDMQENSVKVSADGTNISMPVIPGAEFPSLPGPHEKLFELDEDRIDELNALAIPFCAPDTDARDQLRGIRIRRKAGKIEFMTCDGFRYSYLFSENNGEEFDINIPARAFRELKGLGNVEVWTNEGKNQLVFKGGNGTLASTVLQTQGFFELPNYLRPIFDEKAHTRIVFGPNMLVGPVKLAALVSNEVNHQVELDFTPGSEFVSISAEDSGKGSGVVESKCEIAGQPATVAFNSDLLVQTLDALKNRTIVMELDEQMSKMPQFTVQGKAGFVHGLSPLNRKKETK